MLRAFLQFSIIGVWATGLHYLILFSLVEGYELHAVTATSIGFAVSSIFNYAANYRYTFKSQKKHAETYSKFMLVALVGLALNGAVVAIVLEIMQLHYVLAQIIATGTVLIWNFSGNYFWSFRQKHHELR